MVRKGNSIYLANSDAIERLKLSAGDNHSYYISESELQIHVVPIPIWPRYAVHFQVIGPQLHTNHDILGETEI